MNAKRNNTSSTVNRMFRTVYNNLYLFARKVCSRNFHWNLSMFAEICQGASTLDSIPIKICLGIFEKIEIFLFQVLTFLSLYYRTHRSCIFGVQKFNSRENLLRTENLIQILQGLEGIWDWGVIYTPTDRKVNDFLLFLRVVKLKKNIYIYWTCRKNIHSIFSFWTLKGFPQNVIFFHYRHNSWNF